MDISLVSLSVMLAVAVTPASAAAQPGVIERLLLATQQRPWLWGVYVFAVGLPIILFISFMWPDKRFGPPDQPYYYKKSDDVQPDDPESSQPRGSEVKGSLISATASQDEAPAAHKRTLSRHTKSQD